MATQLQTHYEALGLAPSVTTPVIKASYRALALAYHPDKTLHLSLEERANHSSAFRDIQEAYDCLSDPKLKAKYDAELQRHGHKVDPERSTFHTYSASPRSSPSKPARRPSVKLTSPEEKRAIKAKIQQQLAQIQEDRERRDAEEKGMSITDLKFTLKIWRDLADEHRDFPVQHAEIQIKIYEYETKIRDRELQQEDWLNNLAKSKGHASEAETSSASTPTPRPIPKPTSPRSTVSTWNAARPRASAAAPKPTAKTGSRSQQRSEQLERETEEQRARLDARLQEKARQAAAKQAHLDAKAASIRAEREKLRRLAEESARKEADRIARARAKVALAPPKDTSAATSKDNSDTTGPGLKKTCGRCGESHASLVEWKK